jgi:hypothetical protein
LRSIVCSTTSPGRPFAATRKSGLGFGLDSPGFMYFLFTSFGGAGTAPNPNLSGRFAYSIGAITAVEFRPIGLPFSHPMPRKSASPNSSTGNSSYFSNVASSGKFIKSSRNF